MVYLLRICSIALLVSNICSANPVDEGYGRSSTKPEQEKVVILRGSHVLEFAEIHDDKAERLGYQLIQKVKIGNLAQFKQLIREASLDVADENGNTALHYAAMGGTFTHCMMTLYLLAFGAQTTRQNNIGQTPVHYASLHPTVLNIFIKTLR